MTRKLTLRRPDDWHLHLRDGAILRAVLPETARHFARAIVMPNLVPPVVTGADAAAYLARIRAALPEGMAFTPLMTLYLTEQTDPADVRAAAASGLVTAVKLYPAGATTNSASGVRDFSKVRGVLEVMAEIGLPLCVHGEVTTPEVDIFDREAVFIDTVLDPLRRATPGLRVVMEHVTTRDGVDYVRAGGDDIAATITTHHLIINRNHILAGGKARRTPAGTARRRHLGASAVFPRHRFSAASRPFEGTRLRLRRGVLGDQHPVLPCRSVRGGRRPRRA
jgi:dihydroorotase